MSKELHVMKYANYEIYLKHKFIQFKSILQKGQWKC